MFFIKLLILIKTYSAYYQQIKRVHRTEISLSNFYTHIACEKYKIIKNSLLYIVPV